MVVLSSCMTTRTDVGNYREISKNGSDTYTYAKGKQCYLFWGLIPLGRTKVNTPPSGNCQVRTSYRFFDALLSTITGGIFAMQTIKVIAVHEEPDANISNTPNAPVTINNTVNTTNTTNQQSNSSAE